MGELSGWLQRFGGTGSSHDPTDDATLLIEQGQTAEAQAILRHFVGSVPTNWRPIINSSRSVKIAFWDNSEFKSYVAYHRVGRKKTIWIRPSYSKAFYYLAFIAVQREDLLDGLKNIENGIKLESDHPLLLCEKALILRLLKRHEEAYTLFRKAIKARPWMPSSYRARAMRGAGAALVDLQRLNEAEVILRESLQIEPDNEGAKNELIYIEQLRNRGEEADGYYLS